MTAPYILCMPLQRVSCILMVLHLCLSGSTKVAQALNVASRYDAEKNVDSKKLTP